VDRRWPAQGLIIIFYQNRSLIENLFFSLSMERQLFCKMGDLLSALKVRGFLISFRIH